MSQPGNYSLSIFRGEQFGPYVFTPKDEDSAAINLTGYTVSAHARVVPSGCLAFDLEPTVTNAAAGQITIEWTKSETDALTTGRYGWDLVIEDADGNRRAILQGGLTVSDRYTHLT